MSGFESRDVPSQSARAAPRISRGEVRAAPVARAISLSPPQAPGGVTADSTAFGELAGLATDSFPARRKLYASRRLYNAGAFLLADTIALCLAMLVAGALRFWWVGDFHYTPLHLAHVPIWWIGAMLIGIVPSWGVGAAEELRRNTILLALVAGITLLLLFVTQTAEEVSRMTWLLAFPLTALMLPLARAHAKRALIRAGVWGLPVAVYGASQTGREVVSLLNRERGLGYKPVCLFDDNPKLWGKEIDGVPVIGATTQVATQAPVAVLAMPWAKGEQLHQLLEGPLQSYRKVIVIPNLGDIPSLWVTPRDLNGRLGLEITRNLLSPTSKWSKRSFEIAAVALSAPLWVPLCLGLALLVWLEDGHPPLYRQERVGLHGQRFKTWKFRTMVPNAEQVLQERLETDEALRQEWEATYKLRNDPRITRIGHFLRRFSLDELPQLVNVVRGQMSLVGPRPLPGYHLEKLPPRAQALRERVQPGITGLWQVSGRSDIGTEGMEQWDSYYVRNWSLWLDAVVLIRTFRIVLNGRGAY